jgi:hypothetical protein
MGAKSGTELNSCAATTSRAEFVRKVVEHQDFQGAAGAVLEYSRFYGCPTEEPAF